MADNLAARFCKEKVRKLLRQVLNPDEGGDGKDGGEDEDNCRKDAKKFHEKGASASRAD